MPAGLFRLARPSHWIKNVFVVIPVPFAVCAGAKLDVAALLLGLAGFCLVNSAVYTFNDLFDVEADRLHPAKRKRPIAAGQVSMATAAVASVVLFLLGTALCLAATEVPAAAAKPAGAGGPNVLLLVLTYTAVNLAYSLGGKRVLLLDVFMLSSGFVIRVLLGCALVDAVPSCWLLLCTSSLALFLGFAKREADLIVDPDAECRPGSRQYSKRFLDQATVICAAVAVLAYALYCIESGVLRGGREMASIPFVAYGVLNYLLLAHSGGGGSPVEVAFTSRSSQICAAGWIIAVLWSLGLIG